MQALDRRKIVSLGLLVFALFLSALFIELGMWQLDRAEQKREILAEFERRGDSSEVDLNRVGAEDSLTLSGYYATVTGRYIPPIILLDNQVLQGRAGYFVYTAFRINGREQNLLVNRGWIPAGADRSRVPEFNTPITEQRLLGRLSQPPQQGLRLANSDLIDPIADDIWRVQEIDFIVLTENVSEKLIPITLLLDTEANDGFVRNWTPPGTDEARHLGYAFQWFALAATVVVVSMVILLRSHKAESS